MRPIPRRQVLRQRQQDDQEPQENERFRLLRLCLSHITIQNIFVTLGWAVSVAIIAWFVIHIRRDTRPMMPTVNGSRWWGVARWRPPYDNGTIEPFTVTFDEKVIDDLKHRIRTHRALTPTLRDTQSQYGITTRYLDHMLDYWCNSYDFKQRESALNSQPRYCTRIQGLRICYYHVKSEIATHLELATVPLILLHGWPSSSREFLSSIPHLTTPRAEQQYVFEVVAPDLPGFGFSEATTKRGMNTLQIAVIMRNLMHRLGFEYYVVHGGDWGSHIAAHMAILYPREVIGLHQNLAHSDMTMTYARILLGSLWPSYAAGQYADRIYPLMDYMKYLIRETGYFHIQATKPDTVGVALTDSPAGLAAYILEKVGAVTTRDAIDREDGGIGNAYRNEDLLDMITIMWINNCITPSMRIYAESAGPMQESDARILLRMPIDVPSAIINFKHEIFYYTDWMLRDRYVNLLHSTTVDYGGHFPAMEHPDLLAEDIWKSVNVFINYHYNNNK